MPELSPQENLQRVGVLALVPALLRRLGAEPAEVLTAAGLIPQALDNPEATIPYAAMSRLAKLAADKTHCPHFGLKVGEQIGTASLGLVGELMRNASTLGNALLDFATHQNRNAHGAVVYLLTDQETAFFGYAIYYPDAEGSHVICDGAARGVFNLIGELSHPGPAPVIQVLFSRSTPVDLTSYRRSFGAAKLCFNAAQTGVLMPRTALGRPVARADADLRKNLEKRIEELWYAGELDTVTRLRRVLRVALLSRKISGSEISTQMGMSRRTLHRRLGAQGLRFQEVLDETRCEFARQLLANTRLSIGEIAPMVGYADPSVFTRGFIRWAGLPPSKWRSNTHAAQSLKQNQLLTHFVTVE